MSRQINQPVASVKLTNVATVRYVTGGKRFEVACYRNKVLDYRKGLETDLSEVLQTSNIHIFTNVAKGQFAAAADLQAAFGEDATQEDIAVIILQKGKSLQISEEERTQLYESTLTKIATWIATNCIHPVTGKPYTASQIKQALTQASTTKNSSSSRGATNKKKGKKKNSKTTTTSDTSAPSSSFTVQPHKPIKQQYLLALKYLQQNDILPIQRAAMELQWQYNPSSQDAVTAALQALQITPQQQQQQQNDSTTTDDDEQRVLTLIVDPALYRPLQQAATETVPGSRLEIVRQQVFQAAGGTAVVGSNNKDDAKDQQENDDKNKKSSSNNSTNSDEASSYSSSKSAMTPKDSDSSSSDEEDMVMTRKNQRKAKKKQKKKAQRRLQRQQQLGDDEDSSSSSEKNKTSNPAPDTATAMERETPVSKSSNTAVKDNNDMTTTAKVWTCNTCVGSSFAQQSEHRAHFRSDWHRYNQKLKLQGAAAVTLQEFQQCDAESFFASTLET